MFIGISQMKHSLCENKKIVKIFESCQFHHQIIDRFEFFYIAMNYNNKKFQNSGNFLNNAIHDTK